MGGKETLAEMTGLPSYSFAKASQFPPSAPLGTLPGTEMCSQAMPVSSNKPHKASSQEMRVMGW